MQVNDIAIEDYLSTIGMKSSRSSSKYEFFSSPFRLENHASFLVNKLTNRWQDPGYEVTLESRKPYKWHSLIDLVMELNKCSLSQAKDIILGSEANDGKPRVKVPNIPSIEIVSEDILTDTYLTQYLKRRRIDLGLARLYCKQIGVRFPNSKKDSEKVYSYIGFQNDKKGWELRSSGMKISSTPKYFTRLEGGENFYVFEGFFDFLSALMYYRRDKLDATIIILNSLVNLDYLTSSLSKKQNYLFFDNDEAADKKLNLLKDIPHTDLRKTLYPEYNDFNDFICGKKCKATK